MSITVSNSVTNSVAKIFTVLLALMLVFSGAFTAQAAFAQGTSLPEVSSTGGDGYSSNAYNAHTSSEGSDQKEQNPLGGEAPVEKATVESHLEGETENSAPDQPAEPEAESEGAAGPDESAGTDEIVGTDEVGIEGEQSLDPDEGDTQFPAEAMLPRALNAEPAEDDAAGAEVVVEVVGGVTGFDAEAETVVAVKGSGFLPDAPATNGKRPPLMGKFSGMYVVFGSFADQWEPSSGASAAARSVVEQKWAVPAESFEQINRMSSGAVLLEEDGTFEATLTLKVDEAKELADGSWGIATYPASGAVYESFETFTPITFTTKDAGAEVVVEVVGGVTGFDAEAETVVTVKGSGFLPNAPDTNGTRRPLPGKFSGMYVIFGSFADQWQPSLGASAATRSVVEQKWAVPSESFDLIGGEESGAVLLEDDGTFETTLTLKVDEAEELADGSWGIVTYAASGAVYKSFETFTPITFTTKDDTPTIPGESDGTDEPTQGSEEPQKDNPKQEKLTGQLVWSFKDSWNFYFDNFANGTRNVAGGAKLNSATDIAFPQAKGSTFDPEKGIGTIKYQGTVIYKSIIHGFDIALSNPWVEIQRDSKQKTSAVLTALVSTTDTSGVENMKRIKVASLKLPKQKENADGSINWSLTTGVFDANLKPEGWADYRGEPTAPMNFSFGAASTKSPEFEDSNNIAKPVKKQDLQVPASQPENAKQPVQGAGALTWGVSRGFSEYVTGRIAKGNISTSGVGFSPAGYVFPQAVGSVWNADTQTGTVSFAGVVTFVGHHGLMFESFANPTITVHDANSATLYVGGRSFSLGISNASKYVGENGEVTWSGVPVYGSISGSGGGGGGSFGIDSLSFTVGSANTITYGATEVAPSSDSEEKNVTEKQPTKPREKITFVEPSDEAVTAGIELAESAGINSQNSSTWMWASGIALAILLASAAGGFAVARNSEARTRANQL
ncbi:MAG TPA: HtaA domain-containing protein [Microbacteriaceae bacterium]|nr:HtaA domain-containing protein [Microbacteriaceae bacterium]